MCIYIPSKDLGSPRYYMCVAHTVSDRIYCGNVVIWDLEFFIGLLGSLALNARHQKTHQLQSQFLGYH